MGLSSKRYSNFGIGRHTGTRRRGRKDAGLTGGYLIANAAQALGSGVKVLVADDERDVVMTLGILLRSEGFDVQLALGGAEVPEMVREFRPDVVLLDLGMRDRSGYALAMELTSELGAECPILIAVTAYSKDSDRRLSQKVGFRHHVAKPYDPDGLLRLLASLAPATCAGSRPGS